MKRRILLLFLSMIIGLSGLAQASLFHIGDATYSGGSYKLIYDDDTQLTWLDYTNVAGDWQNQMDWATGLNNSGVLVYNFFSGITTDWASSVWRLPGDGDTSGAGSEMGHLYYTELGNSHQQTAAIDTGLFNNLQEYSYWSGTLYTDPDFAYVFHFGSGDSGYTEKSASPGPYFGDRYGLAVREGAASGVPIPGAIWLLGSGLTGIVAWRRKTKKS